MEDQRLAHFDLKYRSAAYTKVEETYVFSLSIHH